MYIKYSNIRNEELGGISQWITDKMTNLKIMSSILTWNRVFNECRVAVNLHIFKYWLKKHSLLIFLVSSFIPYRRVRAGFIQPGYPFQSLRIQWQVDLNASLCVGRTERREKVIQTIHNNLKQLVTQLEKICIFFQAK